jgi:hypothetical protein
MTSFRGQEIRQEGDRHQQHREYKSHRTDFAAGRIPPVKQELILQLTKTAKEWTINYNMVDDMIMKCKFEHTTADERRKAFDIFITMSSTIKEYGINSEKVEKVWKNIEKAASNNPAIRDGLRYLGEINDIQSEYEQDSSSDAKHEIPSYIEQTGSNKQGSWESLTDTSSNWEQTKRFWESGTEPWSKDKALKKTVDHTNQHEFTRMQDLNIPGIYAEKVIDNKKLYMYIPVGVAEVWKKVRNALNYNHTQIDNLKSKLNRSVPYDDWEKVNHLERPHISVHTPKNSQDYLISPDNVQRDYLYHFSERSDLREVQMKNLQSVVRGAIDKAVDFTRVTYLPHNEEVTLTFDDIDYILKKREMIATPIIWEDTQGQQ